MLITAIIAVMVVALLGLLTMLALQLLRRQGIISSRLRISVVEFVVAFLVAGGIATPTTLAIGKHLSIDSVLTDNEFYNGVELKPDVHPKTCYGGHDGSFANNGSAGSSNCTYTYVSGSYQWYTTHQECVDTGTGNNKTHTCWDVKDYHTAYIYKPYATVEYRYSVSDSLGQTYDYPDAYIATDAKAYGSRAIPSNIPRGAPPDWQDAMRHWQLGDPRPVTAVFQYQNPILALQRNKGIDYYDAPPPDDVVKQYVAKRLVPDYTANILSDPIRGASGGKAQTVADKAGFVCTSMSAADQQAWQDKLMQFNAQLGTRLQGDLHLLIVGSCVTDLHEYTNVVKAWSQSAHYGHSPLSKNGIIVVLQTTDGKTISGADATTGMPFGNNGMLNSIRVNLTGTLLTPRDVLGDPRTIVDGKNKQYFQGSPPGSLESIMLVGQYHFVRACMISCPPGQTGYGNLIAQLDPPTADKVWMVAIIGFISLIFWIIVAYTDFLDTLWNRWFGRNSSSTKQYDRPFTASRY
jgi:hypothetical protein